MSWCHHPPRSPMNPHTEKCSLMTAGQVDLIWAISAGSKNKNTKNSEGNEGQQRPATCLSAAWRLGVPFAWSWEMPERNAWESHRLITLMLITVYTMTMTYIINYKISVRSIIKAARCIDINSIANVQDKSAISRRTADGWLCMTLVEETQREITQRSYEYGRDLLARHNKSNYCKGSVKA